MLDVLLDTIFDSLKLLPFLFVAYLIMEFIEHKTSNKSKKVISKSGKVGPFIGGLLGAFPQCGFSVMASNLYAARIITLGTLISIYLSTSDEMLPILISEGSSIDVILKIVLIKVVIGIICGFIIDLLLRKKKENKSPVHDLCEHEHCHCEHGIFLATIKHTFSIALFVFLISFVLNVVIYLLGDQFLVNFFSKNIVLGPLVSSLIGLIPNCAASVVITELYLNGAISFGSTIAGLLSGSGLALLVLFRTNKNIKENIAVLITIYLIGFICGIIIDLINIIV